VPEIPGRFADAVALNGTFSGPEAITRGRGFSGKMENNRRKV
jgi:hypothetical protein